MNRQKYYLQRPEAYGEPKQTSKMELFAKTVKGWKSFIIFPKCFILDVWQGPEYTSEDGNPLHDKGLFLYPLKTSENLCFSDVFRGYRKRPVAWYGLMNIYLKLFIDIFTVFVIRNC